MEKLLIKENKDRAESDILSLNQHGKQVSDMIRLWNAQPALKHITTMKEVAEFLNDPLRKLDQHVLSDTGVTFGTAQPDPRMVAEMFRIRYDELVRAISTSRAAHLKLELFTFDEDNLTLSLSDDGMAQVREWARTYLTDPDTIKMYRDIQDVCDKLNALCLTFEVAAFERNATAKHMNFLRCEVEGRTWRFLPNVERIQAYMVRQSFKQL